MDQLKAAFIRTLKNIKKYQSTTIIGIIFSLLSPVLYASPHPELFELDGNAKHDSQDPTALPDDWESLISGGHAVAVTGNAMTKPNIPGTSTIFTQGGSKDINNINDWRWTTGSVPDKDQLTNAFAAAYRAANGDEILYFGADRFSNSGDAQMGFWFFKNSISMNPNGTFSGVHTVGDIFVLVNFTQGGTIPGVEVLKWVGVGGDQKKGTLQTIVPLKDAQCGPNSDANVCAITNTGGEQAFWSYAPKSGQASIYPAQSFFEGGINITTLLGSSSCFASFMAETRSSHDVDAQLKDLILGSFPVCEVKVAKVCAPSTVVGSSVQPNYTITAMSTGAAIPSVINLIDNQCGSGPVTYTPTFDSNGVATQQGSCNLTAPFNLPIINSVTATALDNTGNPIKVIYDQQACNQGSMNACNVNCPVTLNSNLRVTKQCAVHLIVGDDGQYKLKVNFSGVVENTGDTDLNDITIVDDKVKSVSFKKKPPVRKGSYYLPAHESLVYSGSYTPTGTPGGDICPTDAFFNDHVTVSAKDVVGNVVTGAADASCGICVGNCPRIP